MVKKVDHKIYQHKMAEGHKHKNLWVTKELDKEVMEEHKRVKSEQKLVSVSNTYEKLVRLGLDAKKCLQAGDFESFQQLAS